MMIEYDENGVFLLQSLHEIAGGNVTVLVPLASGAPIYPGYSYNAICPSYTVGAPISDHVNVACGRRGWGPSGTNPACSPRQAGVNPVCIMNAPC